MLFFFFKFFLRFNIYLLHVTVNFFQYMSKEQKINVKKEMFVQLLQGTELS